MRISSQSPLSRSSTTLLFSLLLLLLLRTAYAQGTQTDGAAATTDGAAATTQAAATTDAAATSATDQTTETAAATTDTAAATTSEESAASTTDSTTSSLSKVETTESFPSLGDSSTSSSSSSSTSHSSATTTLGQTTTADSGSTDTFSGVIVSLTNAPTIAGVFIPSTISVPNTANAPYQQRSSLPEGTVFICVGAALGFFGAAILAWRGLVAWSLHRSVKRAAASQGIMDSKAMLRAPGGPYGPLGAGSTLSLDHLAAPIPRAPKSPFGSAGNRDSLAKSTSSLFFSPTAGGLPNAGSRSSTYLPAGYYAAGASNTAAGQSTTHLGGIPGGIPGGRPGTAGYGARTRSVVTSSPPASPGLPPSRGTIYERVPSRGNDSTFRSSAVNLDRLSGYPGPSTSVSPAPTSQVGSQAGLYSQGGLVSGSSLNLNVPGTQQGRTPSAYLEDLFENHGNGPRERF